MNEREGKDKKFQVGSLSENINENGIPDGVFFEIELKGKNISILERRITL